MNHLRIQVSINILASQQDSLVGELDVQRVGVGFTVDGDAGDPNGLARFDASHGNLATVCNQNPLNRQHGCEHIREGEST